MTPEIDPVTKPAAVMTLDFSKGPHLRQHPSGRLRQPPPKDARPTTADGKLLTPKQIRARARRRANKTSKRARSREIISEVEFEALYKPIDEWDIEELAHGRPRDHNGAFSGLKPKWITREVHERAMEAFQMAIKTGMNRMTPDALDTLQWVIQNEDTDERGKPIVPASAKNQAAMFLVEHVVGKPKQHVQQDISVKLQGILGSVLVNPHEALAPPEQGGAGMQLGHLPGVTLPMGVGDVVDGQVVDDDEDLDMDGE